MYLALIKTKEKATYFLRESVRESAGEPNASKERLIHRDLYDLGPSPEAWINYPGLTENLPGSTTRTAEGPMTNLLRSTMLTRPCSNESPNFFYGV